MKGSLLSSIALYKGLFWESPGCAHELEDQGTDFSRSRCSSSESFTITEHFSVLDCNKFDACLLGGQKKV
jgi:hypothetical protein